ncbi:MAG: isoleucine--tRNA ligase [Candidatus Dojkabacteria bacterium]|nr:isoleucine--tRNA ligase [Candidatus Dojkabacteria bacterium]
MKEENTGGQDQQFNFVDMEKRILEEWNTKNIERKYLERNKDSEKIFSFIDGPLTANNPMGLHHAWGRTYKDIVQRYKNMQGFKQRFQNGFDCQGLWVEVGVERELGFNCKKDIVECGMDKFTNACISRVKHFAGVQTDQSKRLGMFMDWDNSYYTMSKTNNLYIWYFLKKCHERGLLYKSKSATTWCPRCETGLSQHEQADGYKMVTDTSVYLLFKLKGGEEEYVLAWTTTPWTLSANVLLAVNPELGYVKANLDGKSIYLGKDAAKRLNISEVEDIDVKELIGREYEPLYDFESQKGVVHTIVEWELVDSSTGSGVVHIAPGCGQEDYELGLKLNAPAISPIDSTGVFIEGYGELTGKYAHDVKEIVLDYLDSKGILFKTEEYEHSYPHCWRCNTKCLFRLEDNWFLNVRKIKEELKDAALKVTWNPEFVGKRMQGWLDTMMDWMISRKRFYGLALPFYECECGNLHVVGSLEELKELAVQPELVDKLEDIHRPWIDDIKIKCSKCGKEVGRVPDVGDCWLDAGVVPFSTLNYLEDRTYWEKWYPAEFVTEMIEQVRLWFYSMLVFGVVLEGKAPYKYVLGFAELRDENNERMSKTKPNYIKFDDAADKVGSDIIRWNFATSSIGANSRFGWAILDDVRRRFYLPLWNSYKYLVTYSELHNFDIKQFDINNIKDNMDLWIVSRYNKLQKDVISYMDSYNITSASRDIEDFVKDLSQWYIRRSRNRFKDGDINALGTLHCILTNLSKLLAPFIPFISEEIYKGLLGELESVHLESFSICGKEEYDSGILDKMSLVRDICSNGLKVREDARINLRQPLAKAYVGIEDEFIKEIVKDELNVRMVEYSKEQLKGEGLMSFGQNEKYVTLDTNMTEELKREGLLNDFLRKYRDIRKKNGLKMNDLINLSIYTEINELKEILGEYKKEDLQVKNISILDDVGDCTETFNVNGQKVYIKIDRN